MNAPRMAKPAPTALARVEEVRRRVAAVKARLSAADPQSALDLAHEAVKSAKEIGYAPLEAEALLALSSAFKYHGDFNDVERSAQDAMLARLD